MKNILMNIDFNINFLSKLTPYLYIGLFFFVLNFVLSLVLAKNGIDYFEISNKQMKYQKYDYYKKNNSSSSKINKNQKIINLENYKLTSIYRTKTMGIISLVNKNNKSFILSMNEEIDGFVLKEVHSDYTLFEKDSEIFKLSLKNEKTSFDSSSFENNFVVKKSDFNNVLKNPQNILNEISINKTVDGFMVYSIDQGSFFSNLGIKKGDVIKSVNNTDLVSHKDAMNIFSNIHSIKSLSIRIIRDKKIMELNYEIN